MKRKIVVFVLALITAAWLPAADYADIAFSFGQQSWLENPTGINLYYGMNVGISSHIESSIWGESSLTPGFFKNNAMGLGLSYSLLGERSSGSKVAGSGINMLLNGGIVFTTENQWGYFIPTDAYLSVTGLTVGSPVNGRRERMLEFGVSYNWFTNRFGFMFSLFKLDYYVRGSWRDYEII